MNMDYDLQVSEIYIGDTYIIVWLDIEDKFAEYEKVKKAEKRRKKNE